MANDSSSSAPDRSELSRHQLADVIAGCRQDRSAYRREQTAASPWCMELFRRALARDDDAWHAIRATFEPLVRAWIGTQRAVEPDDVVQEALLAFTRYAPNHPDLVAGDDLGRVLAFLRRCTKTALLMQVRQHRDEESLDAHVELRQPRDDLELRDTLRDRLNALIETEEERRVFFWRFECAMKPQQIVAAYGHLFPDVSELYDIIQRITRRLRKDPTLRELYGLPPAERQKPDSPASLEIRRYDDDQEKPTVDEPCTLSEAALLDYITGAADADLRLTVERSPACMAAAQRLARELLPLVRRVYRMSCPAVETLVAHQERRLDGPQQLAVRLHVAECPLCQEEVAMLAAIDAVPLDPAAGRIRRLVEAIFQPPLALPRPVRGQMLLYQTPQVAIHLSTRKMAGRPIAWTLRGQARTPEGLPAAGLIEAAVLRQPGQEDRHGTVTPGGGFSFADLPSGSYSLSLLTPDEEIIIREIVIGDAA